LIGVDGVHDPLQPCGKVDRVSVVRAQPPGRFEQSAIKAFSAARYAPGMRKGKPAPSRMRVEVSFGD